MRLSSLQKVVCQSSLNVKAANTFLRGMVEVIIIGKHLCNISESSLPIIFVLCSSCFAGLQKLVGKP